MRFLAPARDQVAPAIFAHPIFSGLAAHRDLLTGHDWPTLAALNARLGAPRHPYSGNPLRFAAQTRELLADGLHYEARIFQHGLIATREANWHDLLNALIWIEYLPLKAALNRRQVQDIERCGPKRRSRAQYALTHFDEAGAIVVLDDPDALAAWDAHDWRGLFLERRADWREGRINVIVFGHALLEHWLWPVQTVVGKAIAVMGRGGVEALATVGQAIAAGELLNDPNNLRPLPLAGIPDWYAGAQGAAFYRDYACFLPLRAGRCYPQPFVIPQNLPVTPAA
ncbi:MAG: DUF3025 domain-containing protein [Gammaproteobacteria bacterium]